MKRIAIERIHNEQLTGRRDNPELAAMHAIWQASLRRQRFDQVVARLSTPRVNPAAYEAMFGLLHALDGSAEPPPDLVW